MLPSISLPVAPQAADRALEFLATLCRLYADDVFAALRITPTMDGGVSALWTFADRHVELVFLPKHVEYSVEVAGAVIEDGETSTVARLIRKIVHPYVALPKRSPSAPGSS
jgi:hypothetical protein